MTHSPHVVQTLYSTSSESHNAPHVLAAEERRVHAVAACERAGVGIWFVHRAGERTIDLVPGSLSRTGWLGVDLWMLFSLALFDLRDPYKIDQT